MHADFSHEGIVTTVGKALENVAQGRNPPEYLSLLERAFRDENPPFVTSAFAHIYRAISSDRQWLAVSLIRNAEQWADAAREDWATAERCSTEAASNIFKRHAAVNSGRVLTELEILDSVFPGAILPNMLDELKSLSPGCEMDDPLQIRGRSSSHVKPSLDELIDFNLNEIRTLVVKDLQRAVVCQYSPSESENRVTELSNAMLRDGLEHVADTAGMIERLIVGKEKNENYDLFVRSVRRQIRATIEQPIDFNYHLRFGTYPFESYDTPID